MMKREKSKWLKHEDESTDARNWDGATRKSEERAVMAVEQRGCVRLLDLIFNWKLFRRKYYH